MSNNESDTSLDNQQKLQRLKCLRENVNWEVEEERHELLNQLYPLVKGWTDQLPNLRDFFQPEEIEWLLTEDVNPERKFDKDKLGRFVIKTGYVDNPEVDEDGKPSSRRTTPIHRVARNHSFFFVSYLFRIYNRFDVNYTDENGLTHFHVACASGNDYIVKKFLENGQDPNFVVSAGGNAPIHFDLCLPNTQTFALLLRSGADPNLPNKDGLTALHYICKGFGDNAYLTKLLFEIDDKHQLVKVNAQDNSGKTPLYYAMAHRDRCLLRLQETIQMLLKKGANPNVADVEGLTPLHKICLRFDDDYRVDQFFKICDDNHQLVQVDAHDNRGRTPLHCAVLSFLPHVVDVLLDRGADLTSFVFPTETDFAERSEMEREAHDFKSRLAFGAVGVIEQLEKRGYELSRNDALTIMKLFAKYELFEKASDIEKLLHDNEEFANKVKNVQVFESDDDTDDDIDDYTDDDTDDDNEEIEAVRRAKKAARKAKKALEHPNLSLYDLLQLQPEEAKKRLTYIDFYELGYSSWCDDYEFVPKAYALHLCEKMSRRFFLRYALYPFWKLIHYRLPIEMSEMVIKHLKNEDLYNICLAATCQSDKGSKKKVITNITNLTSNVGRPVRAKKAPKRLQIVW